MTRRLTVKKEIRTLGLDLCDPRCLVGAVVRGGLYLDGVMTMPLESRQTDAAIATAIRTTRFFPELRLIMTHDPEARLNSNIIERLTKLPVIQVYRVAKKESGDFRSYKVGRKKLWARSIMPPKALQEILSTTWSTGTLPEPLRIAHLLSRSQFLAKNTDFQANK